ncbi:ParB/RepB/Spo0J family partition protein [Granulicella aggregans]|jgi:ParB family chromosome partitioning protein|uniref:ParB/RepB/Spo0J family partition protein n=1 Tax=Granulicella aggregans TaxID=474949 RepID=UPI0021DF7FCC|nr:ParB/RepB/Spo0J family partition protein [Granulicella aggregans]
MAILNDPKRRALGKGLESLLPKREPAPVPRIQAAEENPAPVVVAAPEGKPLEIELDKISRNPFQTRTTFDPEKLKELAASIAASGVVQPIVVRPLGGGKYQLITGERRWLASFEASKTTIPAIVREVSDEQAMEMTIVENLQRADLNPMEQARAYKRLSEEFKMSQADMATRTGMARTTVTNYLRLIKLPLPVQQRIESGELSFGHAKILSMIEDPDRLLSAALRVIGLSMSVRQTETYVQGILNPESKEKQQKLIPELDPNVKEIQNQIQQAVGLKVRIEDKEGRGRVIIEYKKLHDFDAILDALGVKR